jgi:hypothetical protein
LILRHELHLIYFLSPVPSADDEFSRESYHFLKRTLRLTSKQSSKENVKTTSDPKNNNNNTNNYDNNNNIYNASGVTSKQSKENVKTASDPKNNNPNDFKDKETEQKQREEKQADVKKIFKCVGLGNIDYEIELAFLKHEKVKSYGWTYSKFERKPKMTFVSKCIKMMNALILYDVIEEVK